MMFERSFEAPTTIKGAIAALARPDAMAIAGGQSLLPALASRRQRSGHMVDLGRIEELKTVTIEDGVITVGAGVTLSAFMRPPLSERLQGFAAAIAYVGNHVIRNRATVGGCIAWAAPRGELPLALVAHDALIITDRRTIAAQDIFIGPWQSALEHGELVIAIHVSAPPKIAFEELIARNSTGRAILSVFCVDSGEPHALKIAIGGLVDRPICTTVAAATAEEFTAVVKASLVSALLTYPPLIDATTIDYRCKIAERMIRRCRDRLALA